LKRPRWGWDGKEKKKKKKKGMRSKKRYVEEEETTMIDRIKATSPGWMEAVFH
jgi:hypothetical protein